MPEKWRPESTETYHAYPRPFLSPGRRGRGNVETPVGQVEEIKASDKGFMGRKEMLELRFASEADLSDATLRLHGGADNEEWAGLIGRVKSGEIARERTQPKEEAKESHHSPTSAPASSPSPSPEWTSRWWGCASTWISVMVATGTRLTPSS